MLQEHESRYMPMTPFKPKDMGEKPGYLDHCLGHYHKRKSLVLSVYVVEW